MGYDYYEHGYKIYDLAMAKIKRLHLLWAGVIGFSVAQ
jgi:hypothetical protein